jgi:hypothetical protein
MRLNGAAAQPLQPRGQLAELGEPGMELDHFIERGRRLLRVTARDGRASGIHPATEPALLYTLLELRITLRRDVRTWRS